MEITVKKLSTMLVIPFKKKHHFIILLYYSDRDFTFSILTTRNLAEKWHVLDRVRHNFN